MVQNPLLKLDVDLGADFFRDAVKGTGIQLRGAVVRIEGIDVEFSYGETGCFAAAGGTGNDDHSRSRQVSPRSLCLRPSACLRGPRSSRSSPAHHSPPP